MTEAETGGRSLALPIRKRIRPYDQEVIGAIDVGTGIRIGPPYISAYCTNRSKFNHALRIESNGLGRLKRPGE